MAAPTAPVVKKITQPANIGEKGSVEFIGLPTQWHLIWSGTTSGSADYTNPTGTTETITDLIIGTYYFTVAASSPPSSLPTTVTIAIPSTKVLSAVNYRLYERTGIGDGAAYKTEIAAIEALDEYETFGDDY